jgi:peptidyl-prolyl cis-trans isomerase SurA
MRCMLLLALSALTMQAEIIDRIAVTVGTGVITESDIRREIRLTAFLNGEKPDFTAASKRKAAERMVEQMLIRNEFETSHYPEPGPDAVDQMMQSVRTNQFRNADQYWNSLKALDLTEDELKAHFLHQLITLRFIEYRFRPGIQISDKEVETYFRERLLPELKKARPGENFSLDDFREQAEDALIDERIDRESDQWIKEMKARTRIVYRPDIFREEATG